MMLHFHSHTFQFSWTLAQPEDDPEEYEAALKIIQQECSKKKKNTCKFIQKPYLVS